MSDLTLFEYADLSADDAIEIRASAERIRVRMKRTAEDIIEIGLELIAVKERLPHGAFIPWIEAEFGMTDRSALRFIQVAEKYEGKSDIMSDLTPTALYELAAPSTPETVREEVEARAQSGEPVTAADIKRLKQEVAEAAKRTEAAEREATSERNRANTILDGQNTLVQQARDEAQAKADDFLEGTTERYEKICDDLTRKAEAAKAEAVSAAQKLETVTAEAEQAAISRAKAEAKNLAADEIAKIQKDLDDLNAKRRKQAEINRGLIERGERLRKESQEAEAYLNARRSAEIEGQSICEAIDAVKPVMTDLMVVLMDIDHQHGESIAMKAAKAAEQFEQMASALRDIRSSTGLAGNLIAINN